MKILDCMLRDGGHSVGFNWPIEMAREYYALMQDIGVDIIELGYWKQTNKYTTPFYNLNMDTVEMVVADRINNDVSIMVDYHYCLKDLDEYPNKNQNIIKMIRICARKQDVKKALIFGSNLKHHTGLEVSINLFNISNYTHEELKESCELVCEYDLDYVYFADTHGNLDLKECYDRLFKNVVDEFKQKNKKIGFHFHNHTGKEYSNFLELEDKGVYITDTTVHGIGKGAGNLKLEHVINDNEKRLKLIKFINKHHKFLKKDFSSYFYTTGVFGICESYANQAQETGVSLEIFIEFCRGLDIISKDVYTKEKLTNFMKGK